MSHGAIVTGTDGSESAAAAVRQAAQLAGSSGVALHLVSAFEPPGGPHGAVRELLERSRAAIADVDVAIHLHAEPGEPAEALYIVLSGSIRISEVPEQDVARLGPGDFFGELALLKRTNHSKRADALEDSELMVVPKQSFEELLTDEPGLAQAVRAAMAERLRSVGR